MNMARHHPPTATPAHPATIRFLHWVWVYAIGCMVFSGWQIYNASPSLPFSFPRWTGLGGWLGGALAWHFSAMWLLALAGAAYLAYGFISGHFRRDLEIPTPRTGQRSLVRADLSARASDRSLQRSSALVVPRRDRRASSAGRNRPGDLEARAA